MTASTQSSHSRNTAKPIAANVSPLSATPAPPTSRREPGAGACDCDPWSWLPARYVDRVAGTIIFAVVMIVGLPVAIMMGGAVWSALFGYAVQADVDAAHADDKA